MIRNSITVQPCPQIHPINPAYLNKHVLYVVILVGGLLHVILIVAGFQVASFDHNDRQSLSSG